VVAFIINDFRGMLPRRSARLLPQQFAKQATNTELLAGTLRGFRGMVEVADFNPDTVKTAYRIPASPDDLWLTFGSADVDVARSPLVNDAYERYYFTEAGQVPKYTTEDRVLADDPPWDLGVPRPTNQLSILITGGVGLQVTRAYTYAFVTELGEIGPAADPTVASGLDDGTWNLTGIQEEAPDSENRSITHVNIYRTVTSTSGVATYFFVVQVPIGTLAYNDNDPTSLVSLNEQYDGFDWYPPPEDMVGLIELPSGSLAGFSGTDLYFSEPYRPHAWPPEYTLSVDYPIVGLASVQNGVVILTTSAPAVAFGQHPATLSLVKSTIVEPCLSKRSIVTATEGVYYASHNGLVLASPSGLDITTKPVIQHEQWENLYSPSTIRAARDGTRYIGLEGSGAGFLIDPSEQGGSITDIDPELLPDADNIIQDPRTGDVLVLASNKVFEWETITEDRSAWTWRSKEFQLPKPVNMGVAMVHLTPYEGDIPGEEMDNDQIQLTVYADGEQKFQALVHNREQVPLPSGFKSDIWEVELYGYAEVHSVALAQQVVELTQV